jgi:nicotinamide mononucleotide adenylyltransferase
LGQYGTFIIERAGSDVDQAMESLTPWRDNIYLVRQTIQNDVSSTKVRLFLKRGMSVRYLLPNPVVDYIEANGLYLDDGPNAGAAGPTYHTTISESLTPATATSTSTTVAN